MKSIAALSIAPLSAVLALLVGVPLTSAQGGRGGGGLPGVTPAQTAALSAMDQSLTNLVAAETVARNALVAAGFADPRSDQEINGRAAAFDAAALATAQARASAFEALQASTNKLTADQVLNLVQTGGRGAGARGGAAPAGVRGGGGGGGRGGGQAYEDYTGFTQLWDGKTFQNWDGEANVWSIDHDAIHADTAVTSGQHHIHYIGPGAIMKDFDFKVEVKMSATGANGGIQYRSRLLGAPHLGSIADPLGKPTPPGITTVAQATAAGISGGNPWQVSGYQFDMSSDNRYTGQLYEGQGRGIVNPPGGFVDLLPNRQTVRLGVASDNPAQWVHPPMGLDGEWNQLEIIARGHTLIHMVNGHIITVTIDDAPEARAEEGILSLQLESRGQIWYRNVYVKTIP